jgi:hypothetical protein
VDNKLPIHLGKTECILFGSKRKLKRASNVQVSCNNHIISSYKSAKYLGLNIDQYLSGEAIVNNIIINVNSRLKFLYRQANCLSETSRKTLSIALVQCHFDFSCSSEYEGAGKSFRNKLQVMQNKTVRFVKKLGSRTRINYPIFSNVGILNIKNIVQQLRLITYTICL